jgi:hypothetical protein
MIPPIDQTRQGVDPPICRTGSAFRGTILAYVWGVTRHRQELWFGKTP